MVIDVYSQYFASHGTCNGTARNGALVFLQSDSEAGTITYTANVVFFPHTDETDYAVTYDATASAVLYSGKGRRSKKREAELMASLRETVDGIAKNLGASVDWEHPLREPRLG